MEVGCNGNERVGVTTYLLLPGLLIQDLPVMNVSLRGHELWLV